MLTREDETVLRTVADAVFDNPPDPALVAQFLADPRHHICVAVEAGMVVGFASAVHYVHPDKPAELWINEVAVAPPFQRRGLARAILETLLAHAQRLGCNEAWVLTDEDNGPARALYASLGGDETPRTVMVSFDLSP